MTCPGNVFSGIIWLLIETPVGFSFTSDTCMVNVVSIERTGSPLSLHLKFTNKNRDPQVL